MMNTPAKDLPRLMQLRHDHGLTSQELAQAAGVSLREEYLMEIGAVVNREDALKILQALSTLCGQPYTLNDVDVTLRPERQPVETLPTMPQEVLQQRKRTPTI